MIIIMHPIPVFYNFSFRKLLLTLASSGAQFSSLPGGRKKVPFPRSLCVQEASLSLFLNFISETTKAIFPPRSFTKPQTFEKYG